MQTNLRVSLNFSTGAYQSNIHCSSRIKLQLPSVASVGNRTKLTTMSSVVLLLMNGETNVKATVMSIVDADRFTVDKADDESVTEMKID